MDLYTCFMLMCRTIYSCKIFQGFCLIVVFMLKLLRFSQINLIRQLEQFFPTHLFLWPKVTLNCSYLLSITTWKCFQKLNGFPGIKFKGKINECLRERHFEKDYAVVVGRKWGGEGGCVLNLVFLRGRGGCTRMALFRLNLKC